MATYDVNALLSATAYGSDGDKIGKVEQVFLDDTTEEVTFVTVNTGLFGTKESFVPADGARQDGDRLVLPYTKDVVKDAPNVDADQHLSPAEEEEIYRYYKMNYSGNGADDRHATEIDHNATPAAGTAGYARNDQYADDTADRHDTAARADLDDNEVIRHEERLRVGKERQETGRARLRKYVVTEHETVDVPVQRSVSRTVSFSSSIFSTPTVSLATTARSSWRVTSTVSSPMVPPVTSVPSRGMRSTRTSSRWTGTSTVSCSVTTYLRRRARPVS